MGVRPDRGPGYTSVAQRGMTAREMIAGAATGKLRALYVVGSDPAAAYPQAAQALDKLDLLIVQDMFMTPTAERADFVLPASSFAERDGTYTNAERRVQRFRQARNSVGESRPDWQILATLGRALSQIVPQPVAAVAATTVKQTRAQRQVAAVAAPPPARAWVYRSTDDIHAEVVKNVPIYAGLTYSKLGAKAAGIWGRQATHDPIFYDGTSYTNTEGYGAQWPSLAEQPKLMFDLVFSKPEPVVADASRFTLVAAPRLYDDGMLMQPSDLLRFWVAQPYVGLNRDDAQRLGVESGDKVRMTSPVGALELYAVVDGLVGPGIALVPDLETIPLAGIQTGVVTPVAIEKVA